MSNVGLRRIDISLSTARAEDFNTRRLAELEHQHAELLTDLSACELELRWHRWVMEREAEMERTTQ